MSWKTPLSLVVAIALGLVTAKVGWDVVQRHRAPVTEKAKMTKIVVAKRMLDPGNQLTADDLTTDEFPTEKVTEKHFTNIDKVIGRTVVSNVAEGQMMFEGLLAPEGSSGGLQALVPPGMRAVSVEVSESSGVAGMLMAGCRVDVIATLRKGDENVAKTIVENVKVQAVDRKINNTPGPNDPRVAPARTVTLVVTPKEAEAIELASVDSKPRLVLRGLNDKSSSASAGVSRSELLGELVQPPIEIAAAPQGSDGSLEKILSAINSLSPTTQPTLSLAPAPQSQIYRTPVQIIRGGAESMIYYELKKSADGTTAMQRSDLNNVDTTQTPPKSEAPVR